MKRSLLLAGLGLIGAHSVAFAGHIPIAGGPDSLVAWTKTGNSGNATERQFIADYLHVDASTLSYSTVAGSGGKDGAWQRVRGDPSQFALNLGASGPGLFLIKTGANVGVSGVSGTFNTFLFDNTVNQNWAVIDLDSFTRRKGRVEIQMISHIGVRSVPEPGTIGLFGLGLLGIWLARRRHRT